MDKKPIFEASQLIDDTEKSSSLSSGTKKKHILASSGAILLYSQKNGQESGQTFNQSIKLCMAKRKPIYKLPKVVKCKSGPWYVRYFFRHPVSTDWVAHKYRGGINYIKDLEEREQEANAACRIIEGLLVSGKSPYDGDYLGKKLISETVHAERHRKANKKQWTLADAIMHFRAYIEVQGYSPSTVNAYKKYVKAFEAWLIANNYLDYVAAEFTEIKVSAFLDDYYHANEWSTRTYNNYLEFMITFFAGIQVLERRKTENRQLRYDFIASDLKTKITTPQRNKAFTPLMLKELKKELADHGEADLKDYLEWIFLSLMRPAEIRELRIADIDEASRQIRINGKTGDRIIPVSDQLLRLINRRELLTKTLTSYAFGYAGKADERRMSVEYFLGKFSPVRIKLGLDENFGPYSMKPTGVIAMINAGFTDDEIRGLTGHKTVEAFRAYKRDLVIENSHVMKGSVIEF